jgi:pyruvate,orthophosphate dikinase
MNRDDIKSFLSKYIELEVLRNNPFASIDPIDVSGLIKMAYEHGRSTRPEIKQGICGEHGDDPESIKLFHRYSLTYVSCSSNCILVARLVVIRAA